MELKNYYAQDSQGNVQPGATCHLYEVGTETHVTGLLNAKDVPLSNPFSSDGFGLIQFKAPNGLYELRIVSGVRDYRIKVQCLDVIETVALAETSAASAAQSETNAINARDASEAHAVDSLSYLTQSQAAALAAQTAAQTAAHDAAEDVRAELAAPIGSDLIGFKPDATKPFTRTVTDKLRDIVSVKDFGAIGDGTYHPVSEWYTPGFSAYRGYANLAEVQAKYPHVTAATDSIDYVAIQAADNYVAPLGGSTSWVPGVYVTSKTLILKANVIGSGKSGAWSADGRGAVLTNYGAGNPKRWTDITGSDAATFAPTIVVGRSGVTIEGITVKDSARWSCGIFLPCVRRTAIRNTDVMGQYRESGIYLDATWSNINTTLTSLHPTIESDTGMNEFILTGGFITGLWAIKIKGTTRSSTTTPWVWAGGGTSDIDISQCRLGTDGPVAERQVDGGALYHDAVIPNSAGAGQGINLVNVGIRVNAKYAMKFDHSNRITLTGCYGETISSWVSAGNPAAIVDITSNTSQIAMNNDAVGFRIWKDGVQVTTGSLGEWQSTRCVTKFRTDGYFATPNIDANAGSTTGLLFTSFANLGLTSFRYDDGTSATPYLHLSNVSIRPDVAAGISLGTTGFPFLTGNIQDVRVTTALRPTIDNTIDVGTASFRFAVVRAGTGTINTSDETCKGEITDIEDTVLDAWSEVKYQRYKFKDALDIKGDDARWHFGLIAQRVRDVFDANGLDAFSYGLLCYDEWDEQTEVLDTDGNVVEPFIAAGSRYGIRYEEALVLEAALMRRTTDRLQAKLELLESKLSS